MTHIIIPHGTTLGQALPQLMMMMTTIQHHCYRVTRMMAELQSIPSYMPVMMFLRRVRSQNIQMEEMVMPLLLVVA